VLGILSFPLLGACGIGVIAATVPPALSPSARRKIEASGGALTGESLLTAAKVLSWVNIGLVALFLVFVGIGAAVGLWDGQSQDYSLGIALTGSRPSQ